LRGGLPQSRGARVDGAYAIHKTLWDNAPDQRSQSGHT
jgi:hypothetical protein